MKAQGSKPRSIDRAWRMVMLAVFLVGLLATPSGTARAVGPAIGLVFNSPAGQDDGSFNYYAWLGMERAKADFGIEVMYFTPLSADPAVYVAYVDACATLNQLCFGVGPDMAEVMYSEASQAEHAGVHFAILDYNYETYPASNNLRGIGLGPKAVGYLAGALAAKLVDGDLGVVAGADIPAVRKFADGFRNGAQCARGDVDVWTTYTGHFDDDGSGVAAATDYINRGAAAIFTVAGPNGDAALLYTTQYADRTVYGIGVDTDKFVTLFDSGSGAVDGYDHLLSSAIKGLDWAVYKTVADEIAEPVSAFTPGDVYYGLGGGFGDFSDPIFEGGSRLAPYHAVAVDPAITTYLNGVEEGIQLGTIDINYPCQPRFHAEIVENLVEGMDWLPGIELTLTVDDPGTPANPDITRSATTDGRGSARFTELGGLQLEPGMQVTMSGTIPPSGVVTKTLTIDDIAVTNVDTLHDTVSGTAPPGARFSSQYCAEGGCSWRRYTTAGPTGNWLADFSVPDPGGSSPEEANILDIQINTVGETLWGHAEGGITDVQWRGAEASARLTDNAVDAQGWPEGAEVHIDIANPGGEFHGTATSIPAPWQPSTTWARLSLGEDWTLSPGDVITVYDDWTTKQHTVFNLAVSEINLEYETVTGSVNSTDNVEVRAHCDSGPCEGYRREIPVAGIWTADFSVPGDELPEEAGTADLGPGSAGEVLTHDSDGDFTHTFWYEPDPRFEVRANADRIELWDYPLGTTVDVHIDAPDDGLHTDHDVSVLIGPDPWTPGRTWAQYNLAGEYDIEPLIMNITTTCPTCVAKDHAVTGLEITGYDTDEELISGTAAGGAQLQANVCDDSGCMNRWVQADTGGAWTADFSEAGPNPGEEGTWDIKPGDWLDSHQYDTDRDSTAYGISIPEASISVRPNEDAVEGHNWTMGDYIRLDVGSCPGEHDPATYSETKQITETAPWDPGMTYVRYNLYGLFDITPGCVVTLTDETDGSTTKSHVVTTVKITEYDLEEDTFSGTADAGTQLHANVCDDTSCGDLDLVTDSSGHWIADFGSQWDILAGQWLDTHQTDSDGDETAFGISLQTPTFQARANEDVIEAYDFPMDWEVVISVDKAPQDGNNEYGQALVVKDYTPWGDGRTYLRIDFSEVPGGFDLAPGDFIRISDQSVTKEHEVTPVEITYLSLVDDIFAGNAQAGSAVNTRVCDNSSCAEQQVLTDGSGHWAVNYSGTRDIGAGHWVDALQLDGDEDATGWGIQVANPTFAARLTDNEVHGYGWPLGTSVTLDIDDGDLGYLDTALPEVAPWNPDETWVRFDLHGFELAPGHVITLSEAGLVKNHTVEVLAVSDIDQDANTVTGSIASDRDVDVDAHCGESGCEAFRRHRSNGDNLWQVEFDETGSEPDEHGTADLDTGSTGEARVNDEDGDFTALQWAASPGLFGNSGVLGVTLSYFDGTPQQIDSNRRGDYDIPLPGHWTGTVTPSKTCYTFSPTTRTYSDLHSQRQGQDFLATRIADCAAAIHVNVGGALQSSHSILPGQSWRQSYVNLNNGPVEVVDTQDGPIIAAMRILLKTHPVYASYTEFPGMPQSLLSDTYIFPWYNNANSSGLDSQLRFGNVGSAGTDVTVKIGGVTRGTYPLDPDESLRITYPDLNSGPVEISSSGGVPIIASMRINLKKHPTMSSYTEFMGVSASNTPGTAYMFPWYNNGSSSGLDSQVRFGNVGSASTTVTVTIGGVPRGTYPLDPNESTRITYPSLNNGSVQVSSSNGVPIIASLRVNLKKSPTYSSYSEFMGLSTAPEKLYIFPWYNNANSSGLDSQLRFGNVGGTSTDVTVTIGGVVKGTYPLDPNESLRISYANLNDGPVSVYSSDGPIIASMRINLKKSPTYASYAEFLGLSMGNPVGLPRNDLGSAYLFPWYNNAAASGLDSQLRFGLP